MRTMVSGTWKCPMKIICQHRWGGRLSKDPMFYVFRHDADFPTSLSNIDTDIDILTPKIYFTTFGLHKKPRIVCVFVL